MKHYQCKGWKGDEFGWRNYPTKKGGPKPDIQCQRINSQNNKQCQRSATYYIPNVDLKGTNLYNCTEHAKQNRGNWLPIKTRNPHVFKP